ncbi:Protein STE50 [Sphaceloma murrayae]|uniref:Protein STE50 n=1 Tax=Sphaceloma murrayae TaxID=2082308 RepID=A0A2K1QXI9_9PEZI|nr:Protein STE50 [Sphaceloma murrayae]
MDEPRRVREAYAQQLCADDYTIGWLCTSEAGLLAAQCLLDQKHRPPKWLKAQDSLYSFGRISGHQIVFALLPPCSERRSRTSRIAQFVWRPFRNLKLVLSVGVGTAFDSCDASKDIRLGDAVIGELRREASEEGRSICELPEAVRDAVTMMRVEHLLQGNRVRNLLDDAVDRYPRMRNRCRPPSRDVGMLVESRSNFERRPPMFTSCGTEQAHVCVKKLEAGPSVHFGDILASKGRDHGGGKRDSGQDDVDELRHALCCNGETVPVHQTELPTLAIRGISACEGSHHSSDWVPYGAAVAAACTKELLTHIPLLDSPIVERVDDDEYQRARRPAETPRNGERATTSHGNTLVDGGTDSNILDSSVEVFKRFRIHKEDPCHKILPMCLERYGIVGDWRQYALYLVYGEQERCLRLEEKPLLLLQQLSRQGHKPIFMLRKRSSPELVVDEDSSD